jgi:hypothetical protein
MPEIKDSGKRQQFDGGAVRDTAEGKPVMHLLSPHVYSLVAELGNASCTTRDLAERLANFALRGDCEILSALLGVCLRKFGAERLVHWLELGATKYSEFNWARGMYISRCMDSALRHLCSLARGLDDEDHAAAFMCNIMFMLHYAREIEAGRLDPKWDDMFRYNGGRDPREAYYEMFKDCKFR